MGFWVIEVKTFATKPAGLNWISGSGGSGLGQAKALKIG